jgi:hypothetical protein
MQPNFQGYHIRKWFSCSEEILANETGELADGKALRKLVLAAVVRNPYAGRFSADLRLLVENSSSLGIEFGRRIAEMTKADRVESYGKACIVGLAGEYEHGNALLTTAFADPIREAIGGAKAWISSTGKRGAPGTSIDVPLAHKDALYVRSHYDTCTIGIPDAPAADEIVVVFCVATRGRLHARLGGLRAEEIKTHDGLR